MSVSASLSSLSAPNTDLIANVFDAMPLPAFVVDREFQIVDFNLAGARLLDRMPFAVLRLRGGDGLQCVHSSEQNGIAEPCTECMVRNFVRDVFSQSKTRRSTRKLRLTHGGSTSEVSFVVTVAPIPDEAEPLALLLLDDAAELSALLPAKGGPAAITSSSPDSKAPAKELDRKKGNS